MYKHIDHLLFDYSSYRHKIRHLATRKPAPQWLPKSLHPQLGNNILPKVCPQSIAAQVSAMIMTRNASTLPVAIAHLQTLSTRLEGTAPFCCILHG